MKRRETGILGEKLVKDYLKKQGYCIHETDYRVVIELEQGNKPT